MTTMESTAAIMPPCTNIDNDPPAFGFRSATAPPSSQSNPFPLKPRDRLLNGRDESRAIAAAQS
jgi:hypothetical protein